MDERPTDDRVAARAKDAPPEEQRVGSDDPDAQAAALLADSDLRSLDRTAAPGTRVEHRTSEETTEPVDRG